MLESFEFLPTIMFVFLFNRAMDWFKFMLLGL